MYFQTGFPRQLGWRFLGWIGGLLLMVTPYLKAAPQAVITLMSSSAPRMAPHTVHVHATGSTQVAMWHRAKFEWDFGETGRLMVRDERFGKDIDIAAKNALGEGGQQGYNAAYIYQNPGTYTIRLTVTDEFGDTSTTSTQVTIVADTRQRYYVDPAGIDSPLRGTSEAMAWATFQYAINQINSGSGNAMLLLKRGSIFPITATSRISVNNVMIDAFGAGAKPVLQSNGVLSSEIIIMEGINGLIKNIHFNTTSTLPLTNTEGIRTEIGSLSQTIWDCEFQLVESAAKIRGTGCLLLGNIIGKTKSISVIPGGSSSNTSDVVLLGNRTFHSLNEHTVRALPPGVIRLNVAYNIMNKPSDEDKVVLRLQKVQYGTIFRNRVTDTGGGQFVEVSFDSGYSSSDDPLRFVGTNHITLDANQVEVRADGILLHPNSHHVMVRNNIMSCSNLCIGIGDSEADGPANNDPHPDLVNDPVHRNEMALIDDIDLYNNVFLNPSNNSSPLDFVYGNTNVIPSVPIRLDNVRLRNNLIVMIVNGIWLRLTDRSDFVSVGNNVWPTAPAAGGFSGITWADWQNLAGGTEARENVAAADVYFPAPAMYPITTSTGRPVNGVFEDYRGIERNRLSTWVSGAVQSTTGGIIPPNSPPSSPRNLRIQP